jgi:LmbE family N-acetylglucosaminyl deacetylase
MDNAVIINVHPDDWEFGMGGTAWLLKDRYRFHVLCLTKGERGYKWKGEGLQPPSAELADRRAAEQQSACALIGATATFLGEIDGEAHASKPLCDKVTDILKDLDPAVVFTQWAVEVPDHAASYLATIRAMWNTGLIHQRDLYFFEDSMGGQTNQFQPDLYVDITDVIEQKIKLGQCHVSQNSPEGWDKFIRKQSEFRGLLARCQYAEPFKTYYPLVNRRWGRRTNHVLLNL